MSEIKRKWDVNLIWLGTCDGLVFFFLVFFFLSFHYLIASSVGQAIACLLCASLVAC